MPKSDIKRVYWDHAHDRWYTLTPAMADVNYLRYREYIDGADPPSAIAHSDYLRTFSLPMREDDGSSG